MSRIQTFGSDNLLGITSRDYSKLISIKPYQSNPGVVSSPPVPPPPPVPPGSILFQANQEAELSTSVDYVNGGTLVIGTNDFTIEWWQFYTAAQPFSRPFSIGTYNSMIVPLEIAVSYEGVFYFWTDQTPNQFEGTIPENAWAHIALVGTGGSQVKLFINGTMTEEKSLAYNFTNGTLPLTIGNENDKSPEANFTSNITNFRWVVGSAVYTSNFTPPTSPLANIPGTRLLLLTTNSANAFKDSSDFDRAFTNNGAVFSSDSPF